MAKAKKPSTGSSQSKKPAAAKKSGGASAKKAAPSTPMIDTSLAASTAARMVAARNALASASGAPQEMQAGQAAQSGHESASFKQFKEGLNKPTTALGGSLGPIAGQNKSSLPHTFAKQVGRNQTFGADVNRSGVPRRTGG